MARAWRETYQGGGAEAERLVFEQLARDIMHAQLKTRRAARSHAVRRTFHAKPALAVRGATLSFLDDLPADLRAGFAEPGKSYPVIARFSSAAGADQPDYKADLRGVALRVQVSPEAQQDLLATSYPVSHARDARQFVAFAVATSGGSLSRVFGLIGLLFKCGPFETVRMLTNISKARRPSSSLALETYWSRGAIRWGPELAVRYLLRPFPDAPRAPAPSRTDPDCLAHEFAGRLAAGDVAFELCVQRFVDERTTPIEDTAVLWADAATAPIAVARLTLPRQDVSLAGARAEARAIEDLAFNPWNTTDEFSPLGNLNRARKQVYDASAAHRLGLRWRTEPPLRNVILGGLADAIFKLVNRFVEWHRLPLMFSLLNLDALREELRAKNLIDTEPREAPPAARSVAPPIEDVVRIRRTFDGVSNDLSDPHMGAVGATFGRNLKPVFRPDLFDDPNPVLVARALMDRKAFIPAKSLNILAAAWIQFQVHDWVNHARHPLGPHDVRIPLPPGAQWRNTPDGPLEDTMRIGGNVHRVEGGQKTPPTLFPNAASHWWDGSEVYGADSAKARALRETLNGKVGAKIRLSDGYLPDDKSGFEITGFNESWWLGLSAMHTLFAREHNLLCDELRSHYSDWDDERIYQTARLIVTALIAKIHTVEWTPAILATRAIDIGLNSNWSGPKPGALATRAGLWMFDAHALVGIPKTTPDHHAAPYSLTEDFATVYRMHPLIPDDYVFYDFETGQKTSEKTFLDIQGADADPVMRALRLHNVLYSFGVAWPGAITLHNFPRSLQAFERNGEMIDLSVVDLVRTRRRGVPRYNDFRAGLHKPRISRWEDLTADPETVRILKDIYRDIDKVDTVVGLLGETPPDGFGFSDTAFRIFILMASRRLQSDRFLTVDFRPEIYSPFGMDWLANNGMTSLILRHCPQLASVIPRDASAFAPWRPIAPA